MMAAEQIELPPKICLRGLNVDQATCNGDTQNCPTIIFDACKRKSQIGLTLKCKNCAALTGGYCSYQVTPEAFYANFCEDFKNKNPCENSREAIISYLSGKFLFYCDREDQNLILYVWDNSGVWKPNAEAIILNELAILSENLGNEKLKVSKEEILDHFKGLGQNTKVEPKPSHLIPFKNGVYDLETDEIQPHNPRYFYVNIVPWDYEKTAKCPTWLRIQREIHHKEDLLFVQEWWGYNLYTAYPISAFLIAIGQGSNGKTVEFTIITLILGEENITTTSLQDLAYGSFSLAEFYQKIACISDDINNVKISLTGSLKSLSSGSRINAQRKFGQPFDFRNICKISMACNNPPEISDDSDAFWFRMKVVEYPFQFVVNPDPKKNEKQAIDREEFIKILTPEIPGILNWLLEGLRRLKANGFKFSYSKSTEKTRAFYRRKSRPTVCWIEECLQQTGNDEDVILKESLYPDFRQWCLESGIKNVPSSRLFFQALKDDGIEAVQSWALNKKRVYEGYKLKPHNITAFTLTLDGTFSSNNGKESKEESSGKEEYKKSCDVVMIDPKPPLALLLPLTPTYEAKGFQAPITTLDSKPTIEEGKHPQKHPLLIVTGYGEHPCDVCGKKPANSHLIPGGVGIQWLCSQHEKESEEAI